VLSVRGCGFAEDAALVRQELSRLDGPHGPDVVMVQICPTRLALASYSTFGCLNGRSRCGAFFLRLLWKHLAERGAALCYAGGIGVGMPPAEELIGAELSEAVSTAAAADVRCVLGDRDILRTVGRAWGLLSFCERLALLLEFGVCAVLPVSIAMKLFGAVPEQGPGANDAFTCILSHFGARFPRLGVLGWEHEEYVVSSLIRLDAPLRTLCPAHDGPDRRPRVLAILGASAAQAVDRKWGGTVGTCLSDADRRELARASPPALRPRLLLPLVVAVVVLISPALYLALAVYRRMAPSLDQVLLDPRSRAA